jgi:NAD(P)-dependent dehydrogenase (short-subunit alcohol dehydrogenase family)
MNKTAIITGADGGMGSEITKAIAKAGYTVIMACLPKIVHNENFEIPRFARNDKAGINDQGNIVVLPLDLASMDSIDNFVEKINKDYPQIDLLINNAGVLYPKLKDLDGKWDYTTMVNYFGHYVLTNKLLPFLQPKARIVIVDSLTYRFGKIESNFFEGGRHTWVQQVKNYSNSKLALLYFSLDLAEKLVEKEITVNCSDPGIVGTKIIAMNNRVFDIICDVLARPFMKSPKNGAKTAIYLALDENVKNISGGYFKNEKQIPILSRVLQSDERELLRTLTQDMLLYKNISL